jgi:Chaperone of endosialidase
MRFTRTMIVLFVLMALSTMAVAEVPTTVSYQGRLTTAAGVSVPNGSYSVRFSLWSAATLGTESWSETQTVAVTDGLFSTELGSISGGFFDISVCPPYCDVWLQIEVTIGGLPVTITPRTHLSASPWSLVSRSYYSEASSGAQRGKGIVKNVGGGMNPTQILVFEGDADGDGHADYSLNDSVSTSSASRSIGHDLNSDGLMDVVIASQVDPTSAHFQVGDKPSSSQFSTFIDSYVHMIDDRAKLALYSQKTQIDSWASIVEMVADPDSSSVVLEGDADGDGNAEARGIITAKPSTVNPKGTISMNYDSDDDGTPDNTAELIVTPTTAKHAINKKGTGAQAGRSVSITSTAEEDSAMTVHESDSDGDGTAEIRGIILNKPGAVNPKGKVAVYYDSDDDGTPDNTADMIVTPTTSSVAIKTKGTGADPNRVISSTTYPDSAVQEISSDHASVKLSSGASILGGALPGGAVISALIDTDDDGIPDNTADMIVTPTTSSVAIKTKGTGADPNRVVIIGGQTDASSATHSVKLDDDGDGDPEQEISSAIVPTRAQHAITTKGTGAQGGMIALVKTITDLAGALDVCSFDSTGDGVPEQEIKAHVTPTTSSVAIKTKGTGADPNRVVIIGGQTDVSGATHSVEVDDDGDGTPESYVRERGAPTFADITIQKEQDDGSSGSIRMAATLDSTVLVLGYSGSTTGTIRLQAGSSGTANPIEHSSGAHLTIGGVWTNASDENLKENFQPVDGKELLEKIEDLQISQWNYKSEPDKVTHIGPTAQDFNDAFGLGGNDKTISTIDPSGIALAAIKELNQKLERENQTLRKEMNELKKLVQKLASDK